MSNLTQLSTLTLQLAICHYFLRTNNSIGKEYIYNTIIILRNQVKSLIVLCKLFQHRTGLHISTISKKEHIIRETANL